MSTTIKELIKEQRKETPSQDVSFNKIEKLAFTQYGNFIYGLSFVLTVLIFLR